MSTPGRLLDETARMLKVRNDFQLAFILEVDAAVLCRVRKGATISPRLMVQIMDRTGWHIKYVRELMGEPFDGCAALVALAQHVGYRSRRAFLQGAYDYDRPRRRRTAADRVTCDD